MGNRAASKSFQDASAGVVTSSGSRVVHVDATAVVVPPVAVIPSSQAPPRVVTSLPAAIVTPSRAVVNEEIKHLKMRVEEERKATSLEKEKSKEVDKKLREERRELELEKNRSRVLWRRIEEEKKTVRAERERIVFLERQITELKTTVNCLQVRARLPALCTAYHAYPVMSMSS